MTNTDKMLKIIEEENIDLYELPLRGKTKGLYADGVIAISDKLKTAAEIACVLAEEIGHHKTSYGNILDLSNEISRKQELRARGWAFKEMVLIPIICHAFKEGCRSWHELAEYIGVTEEFLTEAITYFKNKYGVYKVVGNYIVYFEPLGIFEHYE